MQCSAFLAGLLRSRLAARVLVIAPKTLLAHWEKELGVCGLADRVHSYYGSSEADRRRSLAAVSSGRGGVLLTTYGMVLHNSEALAGRDAPDDGFSWDWMVLDEGAHGWLCSRRG